MMTDKPLKDWNPNDIGTWLVSIGMKSLVRSFRKFSGKDLNDFTEDDLIKKCKVNARPVRKILFKRLQHIQNRYKSEADQNSDDGEMSVEEQITRNASGQKEEGPVDEENAHVELVVESSPTELALQKVRPEPEDPQPMYSQVEASLVKQCRNPKILGYERWNQMDITLFDEDDVRFYLRRMGLSRHDLYSKVHSLGMNGGLLLSLNVNDLLGLKIPPMTVERIYADVRRIHQMPHSVATIRRREILRFHCHLNKCATTIQKYVRRHLYASKASRYMNVTQWYQRKQRNEMTSWWSDTNLQFMVVSEGYKKRKTLIISTF